MKDLSSRGNRNLFSLKFFFLLPTFFLFNTSGKMSLSKISPHTARFSSVLSSQANEGGISPSNDSAYSFFAINSAFRKQDAIVLTVTWGHALRHIRTLIQSEVLILFMNKSDKWFRTTLRLWKCFIISWTIGCTTDVMFFFFFFYIAHKRDIVVSSAVINKRNNISVCFFADYNIQLTFLNKKSSN